MFQQSESKQTSLRGKKKKKKKKGGKSLEYKITPNSQGVQLLDQGA